MSPQTTTDNDIVIELRDLRKTLGIFMFSKVSILTARKGEVISLIGSSGSGKSTMLRCANLLEHAQSGGDHHRR